MKTPLHKIVIAGGSGFLGRYLVHYFSERSASVVVLSRQSFPEQNNIRFVLWDGKTLGPWASEFEGAEVLINLAGRTVNCRYHAKNKQEIFDSRLQSTRVLGEAISQCASPPELWINSSSATLYRHALDRPMDEATGEAGKGFSVEVCQQWERVFNEAKTPNTRKIALRSSLVFGKGKGGAMKTFCTIVKLGLGGTMGKGDQYVSWIHIDDFLQSIEWMVHHPELEGPVNCCAPNPVPNREFMKTLRTVCKQPIGLPSTRWMLEIGAFVLRTETEIILKSRRVVPTKLLHSGYSFKFPEWALAADQIVNH